MKIVLTGISATPYAREYISNTAVTLRRSGHDVFVPHEGGWQPPDNPTEANRFDFEATYQALRQADLLMAVLDGYTIDDSLRVCNSYVTTLTRVGDAPGACAENGSSTYGP